MRDDERAHIEAFIRTFVPPSKAGRWRSILALRPERWAGIDVASFGESDPARPATVTEWTADLSTIVKVPALRDRLSASALIFRMGHDPDPGVEKVAIKDILDGDIFVLEGVVSIVPGELALVFTHEGEVFLCTRKR